VIEGVFDIGVMEKGFVVRRLFKSEKGRASEGNVNVSSEAGPTFPHDGGNVWQNLPNNH